MTGRRSPKQLENRSAELAMRAEVADRSGGLCEFELRVEATAGETHLRGYRIERDENGGLWVRCGHVVAGYASGCAHLWRRWKVGMHLTDDGVPLKFHPLVVLAACGDCHRAFDSRQHDDEVRPPIVAAAKAKALIEHTLAAAEARCEGVSWPDLSHF